jgi:DNA ligase (NAD+)
MTSIAALRAQVRKADAAYRAGRPLMPDDAFDALIDELRSVAPHAPELHAPGGTQPNTPAPSPVPMLSLFNARPEDRAKPFPRQAVRGWLATLPNSGIVVQPKIDGVALACHYDNGRLIAAHTRSGRCALALAELVPSIPSTISQLCPTEVRGELWSADHKQATPAAALRRKVPNAEGLTFTAYSLTSGIPDDAESEFDTHHYLDRWGFDLADSLLATQLDQIATLYLRWYANDLFPQWPTDGIVLRAAYLADQQQLGTSTYAPHALLAIKR